MIKCIIVEDEDDSRDLLILLLARYCQDVEVIGASKSVEEAIILINIWQPDLVFMDIEIDGGSSFQILDHIDFKKVGIIFTTAYDHFAIKAIKFSAIDYLLKPLNFEELIDAVRKFRESRMLEYDERQDAYKANTASRKSSDSLIIPSVKGFKVYKTGEIAWLRSDKSYTTFKIMNELVVASKPIGYFEEMLPTKVFHRIHNRTIVNVNYIKEYQKGKGGMVVLANGDELEVSERRKDGLIKLLSS
jgi:two-component system LytT family response regulator